MQKKLDEHVKWPSVVLSLELTPHGKGLMDGSLWEPESCLGWDQILISLCDMQIKLYEMCSF